MPATPIVGEPVKRRRAPKLSDESLPHKTFSGRCEREVKNNKCHKCLKTNVMSVSRVESCSHGEICDWRTAGYGTSMKNGASRSGWATRWADFSVKFAVSPEGEPLDHELMDEMSGRQIACVFANRQTSI